MRYDACMVACGMVAWSLGVTCCVTVVILVTLHKFRVVAKSLWLCTFLKLIFTLLNSSFIFKLLLDWLCGYLLYLLSLCYVAMLPRIRVLWLYDVGRRNKKIDCTMDYGRIDCNLLRRKNIYLSKLIHSWKVRKSQGLRNGQFFSHDFMQSTRHTNILT